MEQPAVAAPGAPPGPFPPWLPFEWIVAVRFLREGRMQTTFIVVAVAVGVGVIVFMSALLSGMQANFVRRVLTGQPHIQLVPPKEVARELREAPPGAIVGALVQPPLQRLKSIDQWQAVAATLLAMPGIAEVAPALTGSALVVRGNASRAVSLTGLEPDSYYRIIPMPEKMVAGSAQMGTGDLLVGTDLASDLGVAVGDKLRVTAASGGDNILTITGVFDLGNKPANLRNVFATLRTTQSLLGVPGGVTVLDVTVQDVYAAERLAQRIQARTGVQADSWIATNQQFFAAVSAQTTANTAIRFFVALSVALGIASVLFVSVVQKSREIGILRAMGISRGQVLRVFLLQGGMLGFGGALAGCLLGGIATLAWEQLVRNPDGSVLFPLSIDAGLYAIALSGAAIVGLVAAFAPAARAARLDPAVAIRG